MLEFSTIGGEIMKKILLTLISLIIGLSAFAGEREDALGFFNSYMQASNNYSASLLNMYSDNAKIIRQVVKPDGTLKNVNFSIDDYRSQMKLSAKLAKLKKYKNIYSNISVTKAPNGYKIDMLRQPTGESYKLKSSMIVQKQPNGKWLIVEEMMQTKVQALLKYAK